MIAATPEPPYYAVIFTSVRTEGDHGYAEMANRMVELAHGQDGFLGIESARKSSEFRSRTGAIWNLSENGETMRNMPSPVRKDGRNGTNASKPALPESIVTMDLKSEKFRFYSFVLQV